jgi:hypothetical protein
MYVMYDSVDVATVPYGAPAVAGYIGGHWPTYDALVKRCPRAKHLAIAIAADEGGDALDCEPGDATPDQVVGWVQRALRRGVKRPCVYTSVSNMQNLISVLGNAGIKREQVRLWSAHYSGSPHICGQQCGFGLTVPVDATQWTDKALGRNLDESLCASDFFEVPPPPDPHQYRRFFNESFEYRGCRLPNERELVKQYDELRKHGVLNRKALKQVRAELKTAADRIAGVVLSEGKSWGSHDWTSFDRGWRYQELLHRSQGRRFV